MCGPASAGAARCHALVVTDASGNPFNGGTSSTTNPAGWHPVDLLSAYNLSTSSAAAGSLQTIAIVDAYDDPHAESDLGVYRSTFGLSACTTANGCFKKVNQSGGTSYPRKNSSWAQEISLDLDMASAICPNCKILLVEASSNSFSNLLAAEDYATAHANVVSNSWGGSEFSSETNYDSHFNHPGVPITVSSGDNGYGVEYPASSPYVTAVGGTSLCSTSGDTSQCPGAAATTTRAGWLESAWSGAGSGCSAYESQPSWQSPVLPAPGCSKRVVADVSAVANPNTGVAVYDTFNTSGWLVFGGTSVAAPIVASVYALAGNESLTLYGDYPYTNSTSLNDILVGSNSTSGCSPSYLCTAGRGFDGPTGLGTPNGTGSF
ncbi:MAG: peptidase S8 [Candidatus Dormibacteraceae bacterium]